MKSKQPVLQMALVLAAGMAAARTGMVAAQSPNVWSPEPAMAVPPRKRMSQGNHKAAHRAAKKRKNKR